MADLEPKPLTPFEKSKLREGACIVTGCECEMFAYHKQGSGFRLCLCTHTQHSHEYGEADVD